MLQVHHGSCGGVKWRPNVQVCNRQAGVVPRAVCSNNRFECPCPCASVCTGEACAQARMANSTNAYNPARLYATGSGAAACYLVVQSRRNQRGSR